MHNDFESLPEYAALHDAVYAALDDIHDQAQDEDDDELFALLRDDPSQLASDIMDEGDIGAAEQAFVAAVGGVSSDDDVIEIVGAIVAQWQADNQV